MLKQFLFIVLVLIGFSAMAQTDSTVHRPVRQTPATGQKPVVRLTTPARLIPAVGQKPSTTQGASRQMPAPKPAARQTPARQVPRDTLKKDSVRRIIRDTTRRTLSDSLAKADSSLLKKDTVTAAVAQTPPPPPPKTWEEDTLFRRIYQVSFLPVNEKPVFMITAFWDRESKDYLFYVLSALVLIMAFIRVSFPKYFGHIFKMLTQTSFRQKQSREQMAQNQLPSLLMNLLFILVAAVFIAVVAMQKKLTELSFWYLLLYAILALIVVYTVKFLFLRFTGWIFRLEEASETYVFIVFMVNKLLGVILLPLLWLVAFSDGELNVVALTVTLFLVGFLLIYRYILSLASVRDMLRVSAFHFFIYLCGVEILPIILIYKVLLSKTGFTI